MAGVWADDGLINILDVFLGNVSPAGFHLHLFKNNMTPDTDTVLGDFVEADFTGYALVALVSAGGASIASHVASAGFNPASFTITAGTQTVYGWYLTDDTDTILITSQRDPAGAVVLDSSGLNNYVVTDILRVQDIST